MGFTESIKSGFSNYFNFSGRASRSEYWYFFLFSVIAGIVAGIVDGFIGIYMISQTISPMTGELTGGTGLVEGLFNLSILIPSLSIFWRRMKME